MWLHEKRLTWCNPSRTPAFIVQQNPGIREDNHMGQPYEEEYYTPEEVAQKLRVSPRTIKEHLLRARMNDFKVGRLWHI
jgi:hypothetical protein